MKRQIGRFIVVALVSVLSLGSTPAFSQDQGFYAGVNVGKSKVKDVCIAGLTSCDDTDNALSIFGGYQFNRNFGVEIGYTDLGKATFTGPGGTATVESTGLEFLAVGTIPLNQQFSLYGKLGFFMWDADVKLNGATLLTDDGSDITFAIGARYNFTKNLAAQLQWQRYDVSDADIDVIGVGILFRF